MKQPQRTLIRSKHSYVFRNKDPVIDRLRTIIKGMGLTFKEVSEATRGDVSVNALRGWFNGATISPRFCNVVRVVIALGQSDFTVLPPPKQAKPKLRLVAGGR